MQEPGYWVLEIGDHPEDDDMVRGIFETYSDAEKVLSKYRCNHVKITRVPFTNPDRL